MFRKVIFFFIFLIVLGISALVLWGGKNETAGSILVSNAELEEPEQETSIRSDWNLIYRFL